MAIQHELKATTRELTTKGTLNKLRDNGKIPCVIYGKNIGSIPLTVDKKEFMSLTLHSLDEHIIFDIKIDDSDKSMHSIMKTREFDPLKQEIMHIDFCIIDLEKPIKLYSEFKLEGTAAGVKKGGILETRMHQIKGTAFPLEYPKYIKYDISHLEIGDILRIKDLELPKGLTLDADPEDSILAVALPKSQRGSGTQAEEAEAADKDKEKEEAKGEAKPEEKPKDKKE